MAARLMEMCDCSREDAEKAMKMALAADELAERGAVPARTIQLQFSF